jgi:hypothetical protein
MVAGLVRRKKWKYLRNLARQASTAYVKSLPIIRCVLEHVELP